MRDYRHRTWTKALRKASEQMRTDPKAFRRFSSDVTLGGNAKTPRVNSRVRLYPLVKQSHSTAVNGYYDARQNPVSCDIAETRMHETNLCERFLKYPTEPRGLSVQQTLMMTSETPHMILDCLSSTAVTTTTLTKEFNANRVYSRVYSGTVYTLDPSTTGRGLPGMRLTSML